MPRASQDLLPVKAATGAYQPHRYVFVKQHQTASDTENSSDCLLFVTGLPASQQSLEAALLTAFAAIGTVGRVLLHKTQESAVVCIKESDGWQRLQQAIRDDIVLSLTDAAPQRGPLGLKGWIAEHKQAFVGNNQLKEELDSWLTHYEAEEALKKQAEAEDDGWTVVRHRGGRRKTTDKAGTAVGAVASAAAEAKQKDKKKPKMLENFYKFQQKNKRRSEVMELQEKFERDKRKIAELKAARRFKPY